MTSLQVATTFDQPRPMSQQAFHHSPADSPRQVRPASQASFHLAPVSANTFSPAPNSSSVETGNGPLTAFPGHFRPFTPSMTLPMPIPNQSYNPYPPPTAPPLSYYPTSSAPLYDVKNGNGQDMMRTISHGHPMHSATDRTASTRYSPSPYSAGGMIQHSPPSATIHHSSYNMSSIQPQPTIHVSDPNQGRGHINPSLFNNTNAHYNNGSNYPMSRSTSGASASDAGQEMGRLLTPHYHFEQRDHLSSHDDMRKVSDPMMNMSMGKNRLYPASYASGYEQNGGHGLGLGAHPQPSDLYFDRNGNQYGGDFNGHYALSSARGDVKPDLREMDQTDYERERQAQISENRRLLEDVGLGQQNYRQREVSGAGHRGRKPKSKRQTSYGGPVRQSGRIASVGRTSYADLDEEEQAETSDEYSSNGDVYEEEDFRPTKKARGRVTYAQKNTSSKSRRPLVELSLWGLLQVYPSIPALFPLFYYTLNNDLTINSDSVPLIGSIPSTVTPVEKADNLAMYYHRGRRVLSQLDTFASRCDRKYDGPEEKWPEMDYHTRIAVRDVRRKVVERCENYKYTRRDILDKAMGKGKWQPIEDGMIEWVASSGINDPAGDLSNVTLTLPTPPPSAYHQQHQQPRLPSHSASSSGRTVRPFPRRAPSHVYPNNRNMSVTMSAPSPDYQHQPQTAGGSYYNPTSASIIPQSAPPMYNDAAMSGHGQLHQPQPVQLQSQRENQASTPLQSISTPMPQVPGGWEYAQSHSQLQSQSQSQAHTPMPNMTPALPIHSPLLELNTGTGMGMGMHIDPSVTIGAQDVEEGEEEIDHNMKSGVKRSRSASGSDSESGDSGDEE